MEAKLQQQMPQKAQASKPNLTGIPTQMKLDFEQRSGLSFDDVRVHYNSDKPAQLQALAYTQGTQVYVGPGQERHLPHELGHVVQQKIGNLRPTCYINGLPINDQNYLEREADTFLFASPYVQKDLQVKTYSHAPIQCRIDIKYNGGTTPKWTITKDVRPNFTNDIDPFFSDIVKAEILGYASTRSVDHIISYETINQLIGKLLHQQLNNGDKQPENKKFNKQNVKETATNWYNLVKLFIPKETDFIVLHNLWEIETMLSQAAKFYKMSSQCRQKNGLANRYKTLLESKGNYIKTLQAQREMALNYIQQIHDLLRGKEVNVVLLSGVVNNLEFLLNSSVGNLRLGDSSTNSAIGAHIDPLDGSFSTEAKTDPSSGEFDQFKVVFNGESKKPIGKLHRSSGKEILFYSKERSMARRVVTLLKLEDSLSDSSSKNSEGVPTFFVAYPKSEDSGPTDTSYESLRVFSSDSGIGTSANIGKSFPTMRLEVIYTKKPKEKQPLSKIVYTANIIRSNHSATEDTPDLKKYAYFDEISLRKEELMDIEEDSLGTSEPMDTEDMATEDGDYLHRYDSAYDESKRVLYQSKKNDLAETLKKAKGPTSGKIKLKKGPINMKSDLTPPSVEPDTDSSTRSSKGPKAPKPTDYIKRKKEQLKILNPKKP